MESLTALKAPTQRFKESVVMVHHYGGHKFSFKRQIVYLNELGFDVYTFDLPGSNLLKPDRLPLHKRGVGFRLGWADDIAKVLDTVPGCKFVYSSSSPSSAALEAIARRKAHDIRGWICDGGPFTHLQKGMSNLVSEAGEFGGKYVRLKAYAQIIGAVLVGIWGGQNYENDMRKALQALPKDFPIISFRSEGDKLVSPQMIDDFFALGPVQVQPVLFERSAHLTAFKTETERYKTFLYDFLRRWATAL